MGKSQWTQTDLFFENFRLSEKRLDDLKALWISRTINIDTFLKNLNQFEKAD